MSKLTGMRRKNDVEEQVPKSTGNGGRRIYWEPYSGGMFKSGIRGCKY